MRRYKYEVRVPGRYGGQHFSFHYTKAAAERGLRRAITLYCGAAIIKPRLTRRRRKGE